LLRGSDGAKSGWFYNRNGSVVVLKLDGKKVSRDGEVLVGGIPKRGGLQPGRPVALRR
jgi:hypothetical protein